MKDPAFLFYPNDYLGGTMGMTFEEKGAYIELLMLQFNRGHMTKHMIGQTVGQIWEVLQNKFIKDEKGLYYNVRLEEEQNKRKSFTDSRKNNREGINQYNKNEGHMTSHMENENRNVNKDVIVNVNKDVKEKFEIFRKHFPGLKKGLEVEYENFKKKSKQNDIDLLLPTLEKEIAHKKKLKDSNKFCPEWKNLSTWINQRCWTQEFNEVVNNPIVNGFTIDESLTPDEYYAKYGTWRNGDYTTYGMKPEYRNQ